MPSVFDRHFQRSGFPQLSGYFGEQITYWPGGGGSRVVQAIVEREPPAIYDAAGNAVMPKAIIRVSNCRSRGIESRDVDTGLDQIEYLRRVGDAETTRASVMVLQSDDSGVTVLAIQ